MSFYQFLLVIRSRYKVVLGVLFGMIALAAILSLILPNKYTAKTSLVVDMKSIDPVSGKELPNVMLMPGYVTTQTDIIESDRVMQKAAQLLQLDRIPKLQEKWRRETKGRGEMIVWLGKMLGKRVDVKPSRESNMVTIYFTSRDAEFSASAANAIAQAYIDTNLDLKVEPAKQYSDWFGERMKTLRTNLETAQARLADFQEKTGLVGEDLKDTGNSKLAQLSSQLVYAESQSAETQSKEMHSASGDTMPDVLENRVIQDLRTQIIDSEAKLQELGKNVGRNNPDYQAKESEIALLKQRLDAETKRIMSSIATANRVNKQKEKELQSAIEKRRHQVLADNKDRDQIAVLANDVVAAQKAYDFVLTQYSQSNLESEVNQTNISVLTSAKPPIKPSSPNMFLNLILALFFGLILGAAAAFGAEMSDRRVRTAGELHAETGLPLLAQILPEAVRAEKKTRRLGFFGKPKLAKGIA
ncbi:MAG TPA: chain length determinant protein EpsF [Burkholderiales bacterium]|nr:chain length determinant protein EpsF [Burkholderiales bacterium]